MMIISSLVGDAGAADTDDGTFGACVPLCWADAVGVTFVLVGPFVVIAGSVSVGVAVGKEPTSVVEGFDD